MSRFHLIDAGGKPLAWALARFRRKILDARGWRCEDCGKAGRLELHHPKPLKNGGAALDDKNAKILCRACHIQHHKRPPTPESLAWDALVSRFR